MSKNDKFIWQTGDVEELPKEEADKALAALLALFGKDKTAKADEESDGRH